MQIALNWIGAQAELEKWVGLALARECSYSVRHVRQFCKENGWLTDHCFFSYVIRLNRMPQC